MTSPDAALCKHLHKCTEPEVEESSDEGEGSDDSGSSGGEQELGRGDNDEEGDGKVRPDRRSLYVDSDDDGPPRKRFARSFDDISDPDEDEEDDEGAAGEDEDVSGDGITAEHVVK